MKKTIIATLLFVSSILTSVHAQESNDLPIIPYPQKVEVGQGIFSLEKNEQISIKSDFPNRSKALETSLKSKLGIKSSNKGKTIRYQFNKNLPKEGYHLQISTSGITIEASTETGAFYANQTLEQLFFFYIEKNGLSLPTLSIEDEPRYAWRGFMLDVARHFFTVDYVKKTIDRMALYKANKLHLHLSDDQGWRIEIKKYPLLTTIGAWRTFNNQDSACLEKAKENPDFNIDARFIKTENGKKLYGGYYTQEQLKELIAYAAKRNIEIIPEIDMPGHFNAAIRAYPFLTGSTKAGWGKDFSVPINPCQEDVYAFTQNVLKEVFALFPSKYIHIGADEVEKTTWENNNTCQKLMADSNIGSVNHLQSYFIHRMQRFVEASGKKLITWDDALDGGVNSNVTVMYWRGWVKGAPKEALQNKNPLIMSPNEPFYFDYLPNKNSIFDTYHKKIETDSFGSTPLLLGGQANLWTEMVPSEQRADYLIYPRYLALAENLWTNDPSKYNSFISRLDRQYTLLDKMGIYYRLPDLTGFLQENVFIDTASLFAATPPHSNLQVHYTLDGNNPTMRSLLLDKPLLIKKDERIKLSTFNKTGRQGDIYTINYKKTSYQTNISKPNTENGLIAKYYKGYFNSTSNIKPSEDSTFVTSSVSVPKSITAPSFGVDYVGYIDVPETGIYSFYLTCDDAGILKIGDQLVVDNDGMHSAQEKNGQAALTKGLHPILVRFVEGGGGFTLKLQYSFGNSPIQDIPTSWLKH